MFGKLILKTVAGDDHSPFLRGSLFALSALWEGVVRARNWAYDRCWLSQTRLPIPVFSIGNIAVGGTGKTPLVQLLTTVLQAQGVKVAISSRGFKSQIEREKEMIQISIGEGPLFPPPICGDEPFFLAQATNASIWVGPDRVEAARRSIAAGANCLILDDGMQHRRLARDFEIILVDADDPFGRGRFLPAGLLRDPPERLREADLIIANHTRNLTHYEEVGKKLSLYTSSPVVGMQPEVIDPDQIRDRSVGAFCGIGKPSHFYNTLRDLNVKLIEELTLLDHQPIKKETLSVFADQCFRRGAECLVCTEKDWVKLPRDLQLPLPILPVKIRLKIIAGEEHWNDAIRTMQQKIIP